MIPEDSKIPGPAGVKRVSRVHNHWILNRNFLAVEYDATNDGAPGPSGLEITGWDPAAKQVTHWIFGSLGLVGRGTWSHEGDVWQLAWSATDSERRICSF